jgi:hypothetical protein
MEKPMGVRIYQSHTACRFVQDLICYRWWCFGDINGRMLTAMMALSRQQKIVSGKERADVRVFDKVHHQ